MRDAGASWITAILLALVSFGKAAPSADLTADELYSYSISAYNSGQYADVLAGIRQFLTNFGSSQQGKKAAESLRFIYAMALLHQQQFPDALLVIDEALAAESAMTADQRSELVFWRGVCLMHELNYADARAAFDTFLRIFPTSDKVEEALLLMATTLVLEGRAAEGAAAFAEIKDRLKPVNRGRATVLQLYALLQAEDRDGALDLVVAEFPRLSDMLQLATFQTLAVQLGSDFLDSADYRKAIICLQRVWSRERLVRHQRDRLRNMEDALAAAEAQPRSDVYLQFQLKQMISKVKRELENFEKIESFDAAARLRLASAYQAMGRFREAALILEAMLVEMPPDAVVESASANLVQCWNAVEQWDRAVAAAERFLETFPESERAPLVRYLAGVAEQQSGDQSAAIAWFEQIQQFHADSEFAPRAQFMTGFSQLLAGENADALVTFEDFDKAHSKHDLADAAAYWRGMAASLDKDFELARTLMDAYLERFPDGNYRGLAVFRKAYAAHSALDFATSIPEFRDYLTRYPGHESNSEALVLLGDAYMSEGEMDLGIAAFKRIPPADTRFFEEGWFKIGKALRLMEDPEQMRAHFTQFRTEHPRSARVGEAIYWIGWTHRQAGEPEKAREAYLDAINEFGGDPTIHTVEELFPALAKLYKGPEEQAQYVAYLRGLRDQAAESGDETLAMRTLWAQAQVLHKSQPKLSQALLVEASTMVAPSTTSSLLMADIAEALTAASRTEDAEQLWRDLVKWNPRAPQKDRALAAIGALELARGDELAALETFNRFEREIVSSTRFGPILLAKAQILANQNQPEEAVAALESLLANELAAGNQKAEALYRIGDLHMTRQRPDLAIPYFQRIYIMHGRWHEWVAKAYYRSGEAFEALNDTEAARKTYDEALRVEAIRDFPEVQAASDRLNQLGGPLES